MTDLKQRLANSVKSDRFIQLIMPIVGDFECYLVGGYLRDLLSDEVSPDRDLIVKSDIARDLAVKISEETDGHFIPFDEDNQIYRVVMPDKTNYFDISAMLENDLNKDILRRDLTINSMVFDLKNDCFVDNVGAFDDYERGILRTADIKNFVDDPLRMLRVFRFSAKYNFKIDKEITNFIKDNGSLVENPAKERVNTEIVKLFEGEYTDTALVLADECGILERLFPIIKEVKKIPPNSHHHLDLLAHSIETLRQVQNMYNDLSQRDKANLDDKSLGGHKRIAYLKLAAFLHDIGKPETWTIEEETGRHRFIMHDDAGSKQALPLLKSLKFSKKQIAYVQLMIKNHIYPAALVGQEKAGSKAYLKYYRKLQPYFLDNIILAKADRLSARGEAISDEMVKKNLNGLSALLEECYKYDSEVASPEPFLRGEDVMDLTGLKQSKELGELVKAVYAAQLDGDISDIEQAKKFVLDMHARQHS